MSIISVTGLDVSYEQLVINTLKNSVCQFNQCFKKIIYWNYNVKGGWGGGGETRCDVQDRVKWTRRFSCGMPLITSSSKLGRPCHCTVEATSMWLDRFLQKGKYWGFSFPSEKIGSCQTEWDWWSFAWERHAGTLGMMQLFRRVKVLLYNAWLQTFATEAVKKKKKQPLVTSRVK